VYVGTGTGADDWGCGRSLRAKDWNGALGGFPGGRFMK